MINRLHSRLSIGGRLLLISGAFVASSAVATALVTVNNLTDKSFSEKEASGARRLADVWKALAGDPASAAGVLESGKAADEAFSSVDEREAFISARTPGERVTAAAAYISAVGDGSNLTLDPELDSFYAMDAIVVRLPAVLVAIGGLEQALRKGEGGADVAAIAVARDRLERAGADAVKSLQSAVANNKKGALAPLLNDKTDALDASIAALLKASRADDGGSEFAQARASVDAAWNAGEDGLSLLLKTRLGGIDVKLGSELAISIVSLALAAFLSLLIARGLTTRISGLLGVIEELRRDNAAVQVPYLEDTNETGRLAGAIEMMRRGIIEHDDARRQAEAERCALEIKQREHEEEMLGAERSTIARTIGEGLAALASGDLTYRIRQELPTAYERLREDFNAALDQLQESMRSVAASVIGVRSGAGEVGQAADNLSRRTEQQAASLEETAAALDEITATVRKSADSAARANDIVANARSDAQSSGVIVQDAVSAMGEIEKSSSQISQIISVIDEIAFQTNLLALNAGVEAARAGEAGRGFAVVASEVRALAQRSSNAAKEIKLLISASAEHVGSGVSLVGKTGNALRDMIARVSEINELVSEIAASAKEQATALQEVNTAVNQMDQVTQQNAAMVEETTAASHTLNQEAGELARLVSAFRTGEEGAAAPVRRPVPARTARPVPPIVDQQRRVAAFVATQARTAAAARPAEDDWDEF